MVPFGREDNSCLHERSVEEVQGHSVLVLLLDHLAKGVQLGGQVMDVIHILL